MAVKNKYAVAVLSAFENENTIQLVEAENEVEAIKLATVQFQRTEEQKEETKDWLSKEYTLKELLNELADGEILASPPILLNIKTNNEEEDLQFLQYLKEVEVDNWEGYSEAIKLMREGGTV